MWPCLAGSPYASLRPASTGEVCDNEFVESLGFRDSILLANVYKAESFRVCNKEWSEYGTCCDGDELLRAFGDENLKMELAVSSVMKLVGDTRTTAVELMAGIDQMIIDVNKRGKLTNDLAKFRLKRIIVSDVYSTIARTSSTCWSYMMAKRRSVLCSVCSGRSSIFHTKSKLLVDIMECESVIKQCKTFYIDIYTFNTQLQDLLETLASIDGLLSTSAKNDLESLQAKLIIFVPNDDLLERMRNYNHKTQSRVSEDRFYDSNAICGRIFSLRIPTFIESMQSVLEAKKDTVAIVNIARKVVKPAFDARFTTISSSGSSLLTVETSPLVSNWRYLQAIASNADPFSSDSQVYLSAKDNMFGAFDGAKGTSLDNQYSNSIPIDLSSSFP